MNIKFAVKVVAELNKNRDIHLTILQISKQAGLSYNAANRTVHSLVDEGVIKLTTIGHSNSLQLTDTEKTRGFIALAEAYANEEKE